MKGRKVSILKKVLILNKIIESVIDREENYDPYMLLLKATKEN